MMASFFKGGAIQALILTSLALGAYQALGFQNAEAASDGIRENSEKVEPLEKTELSQSVRLDFRASPVRIRLDVTPIKQNSDNSCWATVYAMMLSWKVAKPVSVEAAIARLGPPYTTYLAEDKGLPGGQELAFVKASGLHAMPPASYPLTDFRKLLQNKGPAWIITGNGITSHARLLIGIYGMEEAEKRATYETTTLEFIDPASGAYVYQPALKFYEVFEQEATNIVDAKENARDLRWQVIS